MSNLKRLLVWVAVYLGIIFLLGQLDLYGRPVINLASYFYYLVLVGVPCIILIPAFYRAPQYITMIFWASIYFTLSQILDRSLSAPDNLELILVEVVLLELGVWLAYRFGLELAHSDSLMDMVTQSVYPNTVINLDENYNQITNEVSRCRRYNRPLSLLILRAVPESEEVIKKLIDSFEHDLLSRFSSARIGQLIGEHIRQMDILTRDRVGRFVILCPETEMKSAKLLGERIYESLNKDPGLKVSWGLSAFPDEALTFDDLLSRAREHLKSTFAE